MVDIFCPKCGGGTYISEEEFVKIIEDSRPLKAIFKVFYVCRACSEKFSRIIHEGLEHKKRDESGTKIQSGYQPSATSAQPEETMASPEGLKFF